MPNTVPWPHLSPELDPIRSLQDKLNEGRAVTTDGKVWFTIICNTWEMYNNFYLKKIDKEAVCNGRV